MGGLYRPGIKTFRGFLGSGEEGIDNGSLVEFLRVANEAPGPS